MALRRLISQVRSEETIKKSRFITRLVPVQDAAAAKAAVAQIRRQDHGARHHAYAMVIGSDAAVQRSSDDGEPAGTAGAPMLKVLRHEQVTDILAVVTRHFGGVLLGRGGLIRAYAGGVATALAMAEFAAERASLRLDITAPAERAGRAEHILRDFAAGSRDVTIVQMTYGERLTARVELPPERRGELEAALAGAGASIQWPGDTPTL